MARRVEARRHPPKLDAVDPLDLSDSAVERALACRLLVNIAAAVAVMIASWALLVWVALEVEAGALR
jgi:hypothetical protein